MKTTNRISTRTITMTALLAAVSYVLAFAEFPVPYSPPFARMDFSDFPALIGAFAFGPAAGVLIELIKNALQTLSTSTGGVGELANFLMGASFVFTTGYIYQMHKTKRTAWIAGMAGSVVMGIVAALANYYILLPLSHHRLLYWLRRLPRCLPAKLHRLRQYTVCNRAGALPALRQLLPRLPRERDREAGRIGT